MAEDGCILFDIDEEDEDNSDYKCPECGSEFIYKQGRCTTCINCGWSACSL